MHQVFVLNAPAIHSETIPVPANDGALAEVADRTGGDFFEAATAEQLQEILDTVGSEIAVEEEQREVTAALLMQQLK